MKVLFVCAGNIARSQMAEGFYNHFTDSDNASSAGIYNFTPEQYEHPVEEVIEAMKEEGIDLSEKKVKSITKDMVEKSDKVYVLCQKDKCPPFLTDSEKVTFWGVEDPYGKDMDFMRETRDLIKSKIKSII